MVSPRLLLTALLGPPILVGATLCAFAAGLAQLGRWSPTWDLLTHLAPIYLAVGVAASLMALVFAGRLRMPVLAAGLACTLAAAFLVAPEYIRSTGPKAPPDAQPTFKVVQFNAWDGAGGTNRPLAWLGVEKPDVVVVEESNGRLRQAFEQAGWWSVSGRSSVMLFTRQRPLEIIRPRDNATGPLEMNGVVLSTPAGRVTVLGVHAPWPTQPSLQAEHDAFMPIIRSYPASLTILAGDFNSTPWSFARRRDDVGFGLIRRTRALFTWPIAGRSPAIPILPIDHVYAGPGWATVKVEHGPPLGSDHYPVLVTLAPAARS
ncbi:endonuclease/exonuclease/phosphatase family protein [Phenylobacterium sp.]|uniref:endonuclease/exonuclease/phosphatase family protein n=1 Tax=Phenylobacterium sp. TaxID=1871053 RepID=UPI002F3F8A4E